MSVDMIIILCIYIACSLLYIDSYYHVCLYIFAYVCMYLFCMIVYYMTTIFLHDDCLRLIVMFNYDIYMFIILIDFFAMIILLTLLCIFTLLYILFVLTHWFSFCSLLWSFLACYLFILYTHLVYPVSCWLMCRNGLYICYLYDCLLHDCSSLCDCMLLVCVGHTSIPLSPAPFSVDLVSLDLVFDMKLVVLFVFRSSYWFKVGSNDGLYLCLGAFWGWSIHWC